MKNFFFNRNSDFEIDQSDIDKIRLLRSNLSSSTYGNMLEYRLSNNLDIVKDIEEFNKLFICMQFIAMTAIPKSGSDYCILLLRHLYLNSEDGLIRMDCKRPFGNSNVLGDIENVLKECGVDLNPKDGLIKFVEFLTEFFKTFEVKVFKFLLNDNSKSTIFTKQKPKYWDYLEHVNFLLYSYDPDIIHLRNKKIDLLNEF